MHLVQDRAEDAVIAFSSGLKAFPTGSKAPDNMLKMGVAFERMGRKDLAKSTWEKLIKDFPNAASAANAKRRLDALK
jgi:TolA-binding protein